MKLAALFLMLVPLLLVACAKSGSGSSAPTDFAGSWGGFWESSVGFEEGTIHLERTQENAVVEGWADVEGYNRGTVTGAVSGKRITLTIVNSEVTILVAAKLTAGDAVGTYEIPEVGDWGTFLAFRLGESKAEPPPPPVHLRCLVFEMGNEPRIILDAVLEVSPAALGGREAVEQDDITAPDPSAEGTAFSKRGESGLPPKKSMPSPNPIAGRS